jgi:hypothetical protein
MTEQICFLVTVVSLVVVLSMWWRTSRSHSILERWAAENGLHIVAKRYCWFFAGPFWLSADGQTVYYVTVEDQEGRRKNGWVRCGGWFFGLTADAAEVRWE